MKCRIRSSGGPGRGPRSDRAAVSANQFPDLAGEYHGTELCDKLDNGTPGVFAGPRRSTSRRARAAGLGCVPAGGRQGRRALRGHPRAGRRQRQVEGVAVACGRAFSSQEVIRLRPIGSSDGRPCSRANRSSSPTRLPAAAGRSIRHLRICLPARRRDQAGGAEVRGVAVRGRLRRCESSATMA